MKTGGGIIAGEGNFGTPASKEKYRKGGATDDMFIYD